MFRIVLLQRFYLTKNLSSFLKVFFHKNSLIVTCYTLAKVEIRTSTQNRFKNQTIDSLKLLGHNCNHQEGFVKEKILTLHCCGFNLKLPKSFYCDRYFG